MDRHLVAGLQDHELDTVVERMREKDGLTTSREEVREIVKTLNSHSRRKIYAEIRKRRQAEFEAKAQAEAKK